MDDNPVAGHLLQKLVHSMGWTGEWFCTRQAALERVRVQVRDALQTQPGPFPFSLVLLKSALPGTDSWQFCQVLRQLMRPCVGAAPLIVMLSATGQQELDLHPRYQPGLVDALLVKPFTAAMLREALLQARSGKAQRDSKQAARVSQRPLAGMRILVVEDNLINQQVAEELLTAEGAIVSLAANGELGVAAVRAAAPQFDVVLMDIQMPVLDGYAATRQIRKELGLGLVDLPIVAMTANAMASDREACLAAGMNAHVGKPFDIAQLASQLLHITGFAAVPQEFASPPGPAAPRHPERNTEAVQGMELQAALARMAGSRALYIRTAQAFLQVLKTAPTDLLRYLQANQRQKLAMALHTLKGNAATLGLPGLAEQARLLEKMCGSADSATITATITATSHTDADTCQIALQALAAAIDSAQPLLEQAIALLEHTAPAPSPNPALPSTPPASSPEALHAGLAELAQLLAQSNLQALELFEQLRGYRDLFPPDLYRQLAAALQDLDFKTAERLVNSLMSAPLG